MKITVIGTGYVGLVTGTCLAEVGNEVLCLDVDPNKIEILKSGGIPIYEPGLEDMVKRNVAAGRLSFTTDIEESVAFGQIQFIAVGTPPDEDGSADLQYVVAAARNIGRHMTDYKLVVDKSTVPVGTADKVKAALQEELAKRGVSIAFNVASNPEFLKEGAAVDDFMKPDRIVIGTDSERATALAAPAVCAVPAQPRPPDGDGREERRTHQVRRQRHAGDAHFLHERARRAGRKARRRHRAGAPRHRLRPAHRLSLPVRRLRLRRLVLSQGRAGLRRTGQENGIPLRVLDAVEEANDAQKHILVNKLTARFGKDLKGKRFAMWGLAFKPNTDDMREAPSRTMLEALWAMGASVSAYDPAAMEETRRIYGERADLLLVDSPMDALKGADALLIVTEWKVFRSPNFDTMKSLLKTPLVFDGRNLYEPQAMREMGFDYLPIGRQ